MYRLIILFLIHFLLAGKTVGQSSFDKQHEKFIRLHRDASPEVLLEILQTEKQLVRKQPQKVFNADQAKLALDRGIYFYMIDEYEKSITSFHQAEKSSRLLQDRDKILLYTYLGVSYRENEENYNKSDRYLDKAIKLAEEKKDDDLLASAILKKASNYYYREQYAKGIRILEPFIKRRAKKISLQRQISFHGFLGQGYDRQGNYPKCYYHFTTAIELAKKTKDDNLLSDQYHNFTLYFLRKESYQEAKEQTVKAIRLLENKPKHERKLYESYAILGQIYSSQNQPDSALYYTNMSHKYALETDDQENLIISYATLGHIYNDQKKYEKSLENLLKSLELEERWTGIGSSAGLYHNIGVTYLKMKNYQQVINYLTKSNDIASKEGDIYTQQLNYHDLGEAYIGLKDFERAVVMQDSSFLYYDSMNNIESNRVLLEQEVRYKTKLKEQENELLKLKVKKQRETQRNMILLAIAVILLLLGIVYILYVQNRLRKSKMSEAHAKIQNQKLEEELLHKRLHLLTEEINRKNQLIQSLENGANSLTEENLLNKVTLENDWLAFMTEFDKIHAGYLSGLKQQFPELTTNNLRLAALVKLEFSNKEIANILCITENGVKKAKQRLKERIKMD